MEWKYSAQNAVVAIAPFLGYFLGVILRRVAFPGKHSLPLGRQIVLGIPVALVVIAVFSPALHITSANLTGFLMTIGLLVEHGMLLNEPVTYRLSRLSADS
jgi:hypothetical protein